MHDWIVIVANEVVASFKNRDDAKAFAKTLNTGSTPIARIASITNLIAL